MRAVLLPGDRKVVVTERPDPTPGHGEVLIASRASAICRSDMGLYSGDHAVVGGAIAPGTVVPGHEPAGVVVEVGPGVTSLRPGDRVAGYLAIGCGLCEQCHAGYRMLCSQWKCVGFDVDGGDADLIVLPEANALRLPNEVSFVAGALMTDMVGSQYATQSRLGVRGGQRLAVVGLGPMGLAAVLVGRALGAEVIAVDPIEARRQTALELGAAHAIGSDGALDAIRDLSSGRGVEVAVDCSGNPHGQNLALDAAALRGSVALVGESSATQINPSDQLIRKLLTVVGGWYFPLGDWEAITRLVVDQQLPVERLVSHRFDLDDAAEAFRAFDQRETEKAVFVWDE